MHLDEVAFIFETLAWSSNRTRFVTVGGKDFRAMSLIRAHPGDPESRFYHIMFHGPELQKHRDFLATARADAIRRLKDLPRVEVVVVGAGVTGASSAYHLVHCARSPASLLLVDQGEFDVVTSA